MGKHLNVTEEDPEVLLCLPKNYNRETFPIDGVWNKVLMDLLGRDALVKYVR